MKITQLLSYFIYIFRHGYSSKNDWEGLSNEYMSVIGEYHRKKPFRRLSISVASSRPPLEVD
jgi:hypothetical protein